MKNKFNEDRNKLLTVKTACQRYGLHTNIIYYWIRCKKFNYIKIDKKVLFWESDFIKFIEAHKIAPIKNN